MKIAEIQIWKQLPKDLKRVLFVIGSILLVSLQFVEVPNIIPFWVIPISSSKIPVFAYIFIVAAIFFIGGLAIRLLWGLAKTVIK